MKKRLAWILALALLLTALSACSKPGFLNKDDPEPNASGTQTTAAQPTESTDPVEPSPAGYEVKCTASDKALSAPYFLSTFDKSTSDAGGEYLPVNIRVTEKATQKDVFSISVNAEIPAGLKEMYAEDNTEDFFADIIARRGDVWLLTVQLIPEDEGCPFLFDAKNATFSSFGHYNMAWVLGNRILAYRAAFFDEVPSPMDVFDWSAQKVFSYPDVTDYCVGADALYLIAGNRDQDASRLLRVPTDRFSQTGADLSAETLCALNDFYLMFSVEEDPVETATLYLPNGKEFTCRLEDIPLYVGGKDGENLKVTGLVKESCDAFSITLPDFWAGKYICECDEDSLTFIHKASEESPKRPDYNSLLMILSLNEAPDDLENAGFGDSSYELCEVYLDTGLYTITVFEPGEAECPPECREEYLALRAALAGSKQYRMEEHLESLLPDTHLLQYDYQNLVGVYSGVGAFGSTYTLYIDSADLNLLSVRIQWQSGDDETFVENVHGFIRMFSNVGALFWETYAYGEDEDTEYGSGLLSVELDTLYLTMSGPGDSWTTTDEAIPLMETEM